MRITNIDLICAFRGRVTLGDIITAINGRRMRALEDMTLGRERVQEFGIIRRATAVASVMVNIATNRGAPLTDADESPRIAHDGNGIGNGSAGASTRCGGTLGRRQKAGPITQRKDSVETMSKDEDDRER